MLDGVKSRDAGGERGCGKPEFTAVALTADEITAVGCTSGPSSNCRPMHRLQLGNCRAKGS